MKLPKVLEVRNIRVLTSKQIAEEYGVGANAIRTTFMRYRSKFTEGKHFIAFTGDELKQFKDSVTDCDAVGKNANVLYLWTEKGALLHAKSLNTEKAWENCA